MNKHTPGPWRIWQNRIAPNVTETEIYDSENYKLANIARWRGESAEESEANARLIAAAPDLLFAARCALADLEGIMPEFEPSGDREHPAWQTLKELSAAIAKATA